MTDSEEKLRAFQNNWDLINDDIMHDLSIRLNINWPEDCKKIKARLGIMSSCPRYINLRMFDSDINSDFNTMREIAIHELCHFLFFEKWKEIFGDYNEEHYNYPHIIWYLSEAIIDPLLNNKMFKKYTDVEIKSYPSFYNTIIDNENIIDVLKYLLSNKSIEQGIKDCYNYFLINESIITKQNN